MLGGNAIIQTGYFGNINLKIKLKGIAKITWGSIIFFPHQNQR